MRGTNFRVFKELFSRRAALHALCWSLFMAYELGLVYYSYGKLEPFYVYLLFYAMNMAFFYTHAALLGWTFGRERPAYFSGLLLWAALMGAYLLTKGLIDHWLYGQLLRMMATGYLFRAGYFAMLSTFYWASGYIARYKKRAAESERQQLITEKEKAGIRNAYLQQQISPHLLFNTLNFIYSDVYKTSPRAGRSVLLLSDIVRFGLEATGPDGMTLVSWELEHIRQLLEINALRFQQGLYLDLEVSGDFEGLRIIPLVLLTLTENVIKHGHLIDPGSPGKVKISGLPGGGLSYNSYNLKKSKSGFPAAQQLGMQNIRLRLDYAYPGGRYTLDIKESGTAYELQLNLQL